jgi:hypothetical protein
MDPAWGATMLIRTLAALAWGITLSACSTSYGEMGFSGGVEAAAVTNDVYRISARGNGFTDATTIQDYSLLKAAETALGAGKTHFGVLSGNDTTTTSIGQTAGTFNTSVYGNTAFTTYNPGVMYDIVKPGQDLMIRVFTPRAGEAIPPNAFNAQEVFNNINPRVERAES